MTPSGQPTARSGPERELITDQLIVRWNDEYARVIIGGFRDLSQRQLPPKGWALFVDGATLTHAAHEMRRLAQALIGAATKLEGCGTS